MLGTYILTVTGEETVAGIPMASATLPVVVSAAQPSVVR